MFKQITALIKCYEVDKKLTISADIKYDTRYTCVTLYHWEYNVYIW
jgi:hypothetical protein